MESFLLTRYLLYLYQVELYKKFKSREEKKKKKHTDKKKKKGIEMSCSTYDKIAICRIQDNSTTKVCDLDTRLIYKSICCISVH